MLSRISTLILILGWILSACRQPQPLNPATAQATLKAAWQRDQHIVWELEWAAMPLGGPVTVETWRAGPRYRFEILEATAPALVGETLIVDGPQAWQYNHFSDEPPTTPATPWLSPLSDALLVIEQLLNTPVQEASQNVIVLDNGPTQIITLEFINGDQLSLWLDEKTGLPIRLHFTIAGQEAKLTARSFEPLRELPGLFRPTH
jgi:hypothetical protein